MNPFQERKAFLERLKNLKPSAARVEAAAVAVAEAGETVRPAQVACPNCQEALTLQQLSENLRVCPLCGHHFPITAYHRLKILLDSGSFKELFATVKGGNPLAFSGYTEKIAALQQATGLSEGVICALGKLEGNKALVCAMDSRFLMGSMGCAVGEKITLATEYATRQRLPLILCCASGGARMQEGILSLFQMAKTAAALENHAKAGLLFISVLTHPTTGGVTASFASLGDIIVAEPGALIGFAGPRVIEQTIRQKLPEGFQRAEYLLEHGFVDAIVPRTQLKSTLARLLALHKRRAK